MSAIATELRDDGRTTNHKKPISQREVMVKLMTDDEFINKYEKYEEDAVAAYIDRFARTRREVKDIIAHLIQQRELLHEADIKSLEAEAQKLIERLNAVNLETLLSELECFKDVLELQKHALETNGAP